MPFGLDFQTTIRDSLYDLIPLSSQAAEVLATPVFQRLEGIQQLGFVSRVWPGARHTRFEHSLGVMHLMTLALERLNASDTAVSAEGARTGIAAALLHDIGHYPFSHAIEELGPPVAPHEAVGARLIKTTELSEILRERWEIDPNRVAALLSAPGGTLAGEDRLLAGLLSGPLDVDKLDYLPRDARACHVPYGGVDTIRLLDALRIVEADGGASVGIDQKGVSPLHSLINARQEMFDNVYWHHTNRAGMAMLLRAVQDALSAGLPAGELTNHTDSSLLTRLSQPDQPETTRSLVAALQRRTFHKRAVEVSSRAPELFAWIGALFHQPARRRELERTMAERLGRETGRPAGEADILIDIPKPERWKTDLFVRFERPPVGFTPVMTWQDVTGMGDDDLRGYEEHRRLIRIVTAEPLREVVQARWERLLLPLLSAG
jgi:HD superfamily phosphohydrolase